MKDTMFHENTVIRQKYISPSGSPMKKGFRGKNIVNMSNLNDCTFRIQGQFCYHVQHDPYSLPHAQKQFISKARNGVFTGLRLIRRTSTLNIETICFANILCVSI